MNKKANIGAIILMFFLLFMILFLGFLMIVGSSVINWVWDVAYPEVSNLGMVDKTNMTRVAEVTTAPVNTFLQSMTWLTGVLYVLMLIGSVAIAFIARTTPSKWLIGFYFMMAIILVMGSILISNIYEDFHDDTGELGDRLREHAILSFMILHAPAIFTVIIFTTGIVLFSGLQEEEFV